MTYDWIPLVETTGAFLAPPVLAEAFPHGLTPHDAGLRRDLRDAAEEWAASEDPAYHRAFLDWFLERILGIPTTLTRSGADLPAGLSVSDPRSGEILAPDLAVLRPGAEAAKPVLLFRRLPRGRDPRRVPANVAGALTPTEQMEVLLRGANVALGLVTDGAAWALVHAPRGESSSTAVFTTELLIEEPDLLRALRTVVGWSTLASPQPERDLQSLWAKSLGEQAGVTEALGNQVRRAVEILIHSLDRQDRERHGALLAGAAPKVLYEAACTVMMRLVFLLAAEGRDLLPIQDELWQESYAASTLRDQLKELADREGPEVLEHRFAAWSRLLATFRAVHSGLDHDALPRGLPAYGGGLFNPDRYPFLEGRAPGSSWKGEPSEPLPIDDRTVLTLLDALQVLERPASQGGAQRLSFRSLDVEQIGHVYEGLLEHTVLRAEDVVLGLGGKLEPEIPLGEVEALVAKGTEQAAAELAKATGRSAKAMVNLLETVPEGATEGLRRACEGDDALVERLAPLAGVIRRDARDLPVVILPGSVYVTQGSDRRTTGTHYTPRSLTEPVVKHALEPLLYPCLAEGGEMSPETMISAKEILELRVLDPACGSGAFLVEACRQLAEALCAAWEYAEAKVGAPRLTIPVADPSTGKPTERLLPEDPEERRILARRLVADRCLLGVDKNPMAVEMAKLSLWLITMQVNRPFTFLDHSLKSGDSLFGVTRRAQLQRFDMRGENTQLTLFNWDLPGALQEAAGRRSRIEGLAEEDIQDVQRKSALLAEADGYTEELRVAADLLVGVELNSQRDPGRSAETRTVALEQVRGFLRSPGVARPAALDGLRELARGLLDGGASEPPGGRRAPFHWLLEFPEVFEGKEPGVDAVVGNPPFRGGAKLATDIGYDLRAHLLEHVGCGVSGVRGTGDLCAYFALRGASLLRKEGVCGLVATNSIAQGDTKALGLSQLLSSGYSIPRAISSLPWPGSANLEIALVWIRRGTWGGRFVLDGTAVDGINASLEVSGSALGDPMRLCQQKKLSFKGSMPYGEGFLLPPEEAQEIVARDSASGDVLFPFLGGNDITSSPALEPSRWIINFFDWPLEKAEEYSICHQIVLEKVKPERDKLLGRNPMATRRGTIWWQFAGRSVDLYRSIEGLDRVLVLSKVAKHLAFAFVPTNQVFSERVSVFSYRDWRFLAVLQSSVHEVWVRRYSSTLETRLSYTPSMCFENFAMPGHDHLEALDDIGERYDTHRRTVMLERQEGLTRTYNRFHDPDERADDIACLRHLHVEMDRAVAAAYNWADLDLGHGFHETDQGTRYTLSPKARSEVLSRLLRLNHERYAEEVAKGLHDKKKGKGKARKKKAKPRGASKPKSGRKRIPSGPAEGQLGLFQATSTPPRVPPDPSPGQLRSGPDAAEVALLEALREAGHPLGKSALIKATGLDTAIYSRAIRVLVDAGQVIKEGIKRGTKYRLPDGSGDGQG